MFRDKESIIISNDTPLVVDKLTVYPNRFIYKKKEFNFAEIESLSWYWLTRIINGISNQEIKFIINVKNSDTRIKIKNSLLVRQKKLVKAYEFIAEETFQNRLKKYLDQFDKYGCFKYQYVLIYSDGQVKYGKKYYSLENAQLEPFKIKIKQGGMFSSKCVIETRIDRDVILSLIDYILKNPQDPQQIRENTRKKQKAEKSFGVYLPNLISMLAKISKADERVTSEEIEVVSSFFLNDLKLDKQSFQNAIAIFNNTKDSLEPISYFANKILNEVGTDQNLLINTVNLLFSVATADNYFSAEEELMISEIETIFGVIGKTSYSFYRNNQSKNKEEMNESKYYEILGLKSDCNISEIKSAYRKLVMLYHPDRVQHLGMEFSELAEEKIKEINNAYEYFSKKYNLN